MSWLYTLVFAGLSISSPGAPAPVQPLPLIPESAVVATAADETENFEKSYPLNANGRVNLSNVNGSIVVEGWDRNEVKLQYTKVADTKDRLADVEVRIDSRADYFNAEVDYGNWRKGTDGWKSGKLNVDFRLMVPRGAMLNEVETVNGSVTVSNFTNFTKISAVNGSVKASNIRGTTSLSTVNGEVVADFDRLEAGTKINGETVNGRVNITIPSDSNATLKAESLNGSITNDFALPVHKGKYVGRDVYGKIGSGDVQIRLESVNGTLNVGRKNDGKSLSPSVNLFTNKGRDDDNDWEKEMSVNTAKMNKDIAKAVKDSARISAKAMAEANVQIEKMAPEITRLAAEAAISAVDMVKLADVQDKLSKTQFANADRMMRLADMGFAGSMPRIEAKSGVITVKGVPTITIDAEPCSVRVIGWDQSEVKYRVVQQMETRRNEPLKISESHSDSSVKLTVEEPSLNHQERYYGADQRTLITIYVPRKSNLKINANGSLRVEGVSGNLELMGGEETINVRDSEGRLKVTNTDGQVRVIGFNGEIDSNTGDGQVFLEGQFSRITGNAREGSYTLTVPDTPNMDIKASVEALTIENLKVPTTVSEGHWRFGSGGPKYTFNLSDGRVTVRSAASLTQ